MSVIIKFTFTGSAIQASASPQQHQSIPVYQRSQAPSYPYSLAQPSCNIYICTQPAAGNLQTRPQSSYLTGEAFSLIFSCYFIYTVIFCSIINNDNSHQKHEP